ncbi:DUF4386 domain-containing protein [Microbacterium sp. No. 7]|uniref:DUF4386 domain-containing protein n=1 Tax=Microbacterium sp. No. 7 TaxID=1714373 RepID=UPI0006D0F174|nr:DUF4386 domain-containing protein [Microbacterium sp. No. 7]ALJ18645.1 hypothetical protein AOA12_01430 [Microbacterium sp. No. 7]
MTTDRRLALTAGLLYLATFATSFPGLALRTAFFDGDAAPATAGSAALVELLLAAACVGTALALFPIARRVSLPLALGFVVSRTLEAAMIMTGVLALLATAAVRAAGGGDDALVALHDASFLVGPAFMSATNALLLGSVMFRGRLVPRVIPLIGLIGAPLLLASSIGVLFGAWTQTSAVGAIAAVPVALWELALGVWLTVRGVAPGIPRPADHGPRGISPASDDRHGMTRGT